MDIISEWWQWLWNDPSMRTTVFGAITAIIVSLVPALFIFFITQVVWNSRVERMKIHEAIWRHQYDNVYSPLVVIYRRAYTKYDFFKKNEDPLSKLLRQPIFDTDNPEVMTVEEHEVKLVETIIDKFRGYCSVELSQRWEELKFGEGAEERLKRREKFIRVLLHDYHDLRSKLTIGSDEEEFETGKFRVIK